MSEIGGSFSMNGMRIEFKLESVRQGPGVCLIEGLQHIEGEGLD